MSVKPNSIGIALGDDILDLGDLKDKDWAQVQILSDKALKDNLTTDSYKAYVIGFLSYISELEDLSEAAKEKPRLLN